MNSTKPGKLADLQSAPTTILVADDDPVTRQLLNRLLQEKGHQVILACDGEDAWSQYLTHQPRMVLSDWRMPKLDGVDLCQRIREHKDSQYTFVLILTSATDRDVMERGFAAGADDFMTKPIDRGELTWRIFSGMRVLGLQTTQESRINQLDETRACLQAANGKMQEGLMAAAKTQRALLPKHAPDVNKISCAWSYQPSDHLGGDSINVFKLDETQFGFFVADVCGHGLPSALVAVALHRVLTPLPNQMGLLQTDEQGSPFDLFRDPGRVLTEVNRRFPIKIEEGEYFTSVYGVIDIEKAELAFCGAGHPNPVIISKDGTVKKLATDGFPVGFDDDAVYETQRVALGPGDRIVAYTDGILEAYNPKDEMYGLQRLIDHFRCQADSTLQQAVDELNVALNNWTADLGQQDDLSIVTVEFEGCPATNDPPKNRTMTPTIPLDQKRPAIDMPSVQDQ